MPGRERVRTMLEAGLGYEDIAAHLHVSPGLVYLVATGMPADGSDAPAADAHERLGFLKTSQHLSNPQPADNPTSKDSVLAWIKGRVSGDLQMREAAAARDPAPGKKQPADGDEDVDLVDHLTRDHNQVTAMLKQLATIPGKVKGGTPAQMSTRKSIVDMVTDALSRHETAEQQVLWPAVRASLPDGDQRADTALQQEQEGDDVLAALGRHGGDTEKFDELVERLTADARIHVAFEETVFLDLRDRLDREELKRLGTRFVAARAAAGQKED